MLWEGGSVVGVAGGCGAVGWGARTDPALPQPSLTALSRRSRPKRQTGLSCAPAIKHNYQRTVLQPVICKRHGPATSIAQIKLRFAARPAPARRNAPLHAND